MRAVDGAGSLGVDEAAEVSEIEAWAAGLAALHARLAPRFARAEPRARALAYLQGLLGPVERKNGWQLAEYAGEATPDGMQRLLATAKWDADAVRDDLRGYVLAHLSAPAGVLVGDETGFLKKGTKSVGVQRQYSGTAGKVENCQLGVFLTYASAAGHAFLDRELYLPQRWADDPVRRREAGVPESVTFRTKPQLLQVMLERAFTAGVRVAWVTADECYGHDPKLRRWLEERNQGYVLAVRCTTEVPIRRKKRNSRMAVKLVVAELAPEAWTRLSAGAGSTGPRTYDWACVPLQRTVAPGWAAWLLVRRSVSDPTELAYYLTFGPAATPLTELVRVAGLRWTIETSLEDAKGEVGLDQYEVRRWDGWYRHSTLALLAHAYLTVTRLRAQEKRAS